MLTVEEIVFPIYVLFNKIKSLSLKKRINVLKYFLTTTCSRGKLSKRFSQMSDIDTQRRKITGDKKNSNPRAMACPYWPYWWAWYFLITLGQNEDLQSIGQGTAQRQVIPVTVTDFLTHIIRKRQWPVSVTHQECKFRDPGIIPSK